MKPGESLVSLMPRQLQFPIRGKVTPRVAVIGAGVIGLATAVRTAERLPGVRVDLLAEHFSPLTTGDGSAGFWNPYLPGDVPDDILRQWSGETFSFLANLVFSSQAANHGVTMLSAYWLSEEHKERPIYWDLFFNFQDMTESELKRFPKNYKSGFFFTTISVACNQFLPKLLERFLAVGGRVEQRKVTSIEELSPEYDVVVVCGGVESARLTGDPTVFPIRGQVFKVKAPWVKHAILDDHFHILPGAGEWVTLGGTKQEGNWSTEVDPEDSKRIWNGCLKLVPSLKDAEVVKEWVGLRPGRTSGPRIEMESRKGKDGKPLKVVHHYGHGGSGVTLFWGCAGQAAGLVVEAVRQLQQPLAQSHL